MSEITIPFASAFEPLLAPARYKGAKGGRASGKSHFYADLWLDENIREKLDVVCLREVQKSLQLSVKKTLESKIEKYNAGFYFEVQDKIINTALGGLTIFEGMQSHTADSIRSLEAFDRAWFEESQRASQKSLDILRPTIRKPGSEMWFSWNPHLPTDPIEQFFADMPEGAVLVTANYMDNPWLSEESRKDMEYDKKRDLDKYSHVWLGGYQTHSEARVFKNWKVEEFELPAGSTFRMGADWGYSIDPSCLVRCSLAENRLYIDYEAYMVGCEITQLPDLFDRVPESRKWFITADSARPETISYMQKHGFPKMNYASKGKGSVEEGIAFLQSFDIIVHPRCKHTIDELTMYHYKRDPLTDEILPVLDDKNNHLIDALRYACEGVRKAGKEVKPEPYTRRVNVSRQGWMAS